MPLLVTMLAAGTRAKGQAPAEPSFSPHGSYLFRTYCASCHGVSARGDGPLAASMRRRPPNLTEIAKRHKGTYPSEKVFRIIDGREKVPGHGGPDMPVWGDSFRNALEGGDEQTVRARIQALVGYLESIQGGGAQ
ncbi:MAG: c-type cytochrome [Acidobacteriota bacterium]